MTSNYGKSTVKIEITTTDQNEYHNNHLETENELSKLEPKAIDATYFGRKDLENPDVFTHNEDTKNVDDAISNVKTISNTENEGNKRFLIAIVVICACGMIANTTPVVLLPVIAADPFFAIEGATSTPPLPEATKFVGGIVSLSSLGAACGKFLNGFVCQWIGGRDSARLYLFGLCGFSILLSYTSSMYGLAVAGMEFCNSILWTACTVLLSSRYEGDPKKFSEGMTALSLSVTSGTLISKIFGSVLLTSMHWRTVTRISASVAFLGSAIAHFFISNLPQEPSASSGIEYALTSCGKKSRNSRRKTNFNGPIRSIINVVGNKMFWMVAISHACSYLVRSSDKILGTFIHETSNMPRKICGSLTSFVTIGFVVGLITGRKMNNMETIVDKKRFIANRYKTAVYFNLCLALCAHKNFVKNFSSIGLTVIISLASGMMAASISYQFYQFPALFGNSFGKDKAICISFMDGMGFLIGSPIWSAMSSIVSSEGLNPHGWTLAWIMITVWLILGGVLMMKALPTVMQWKSKKDATN